MANSAQPIATTAQPEGSVSKQSSFHFSFARLIMYLVLLVGVLASIRGGSRDPVPLRSPLHKDE